MGKGPPGPKAGAAWKGEGYHETCRLSRSFDPVTLGHLDIIVRASRIFDQLIVGVPTNPEKHASFTVEERMELLRRATQAEGLRNVEIDKVDGLLADYAKRRGAMVVVKGCGPCLI
mgnify:CR=1 FL=1